ncbi:hypothetical protein B0H21DRAFT_819617 [Amylocystis lapponica]|nr:hypothetical protein B0H21DRAFT_819617 [Amylocystis lapponica]
MSSPSPSSPSMASLVSTTTAHSSKPLVSPPQKDFGAAFAKLQAMYGTTGAAPISSLFSRSKQPVKQTSTATPKRAKSTSAPFTSPKNFEAAFGTLSSSYGYTGAAPSQAHPKAV